MLRDYNISPPVSKLAAPSLSCWESLDISGSQDIH